MKKYSTICGLFFVFLFLLIININLVCAAGFLPTTETGGGTCPEGSDNCGRYTLNEMVSVVVIVAQWLLGIVGSLALVMFIYGGVIFLISAGNTEQVKKGKEIILGAVIGLAIVFTSYTIIHLVFTALGVPLPTGTNWFTSGWFNPTK